MNNYVWIALGAVAAILILRKLQGAGDSSTDAPPNVSQDPEGVKRLLAEGHPIKAMQLAQQITGHDPAKVQALLEALGVQVKVSVSGHVTTMTRTEIHRLDPAQLQEIRDLLAAGKKAEATERMQELTGIDLTMAKNAIAKLEADAPPQ